MNLREVFLYIFVMASITYLVRTVPFILFRKPIRSLFWQSFLNYIPYTVLAAMTVPAIFYATDSRLSGAFAFACAVAVSFCGKGLVAVACAASFAVLVVDGLL